METIKDCAYCGQAPVIMTIVGVGWLLECPNTKITLTDLRKLYTWVVTTEAAVANWNAYQEEYSGDDDEYHNESSIKENSMQVKTYRNKLLAMGFRVKMHDGGAAEERHGGRYWLELIDADGISCGGGCGSSPEAACKSAVENLDEPEEES
jgi:hypothetical protein